MKNSNYYQKGAAMTEFALVAILFFTLMFGIVEFGRLMFTKNTLAQVTRRAARMAAVCPPDIQAIKLASIFGDPTTGTPGYVVNNLTTANVNLDYFYWQPANAVAGTPRTLIHETNPSSIAGRTNLLTLGSFVVATIINYQHQMIVPFLTPTTFNSPPYQVTIPIEALGLVKGVGINECPFP